MITLLQSPSIFGSAVTVKLSCCLWNCGFFSMTVSLIALIFEPPYQGGEIPHHTDVVTGGNVQYAH